MQAVYEILSDENKMGEYDETIKYSKSSDSQLNENHNKYSQDQNKDDIERPFT